MLTALRIIALSLLIFPMQTYAQSDKAQQASKGDKPSLPTTSFAQNEGGTPALKTEDRKHIDADVRVIQTPTKDSYDKAAFWINAALAGIGIIGVGIGIGTLLFLRRQTAHIKRQADQMEAQLQEMKKVSELENKTLILQYRPKVIVRNATAKAFSKEIGGGVFSEPVRCVVAFQIVNIGGSPAHIVDGDIYLLSARASGLEEEIEFKESTHVGIGQRTLQPGEREAIEFGLDTRIPNDARWVEFYKGASSHSIFLLGTIWYRDDLEIPRQTGLHRSYDPKTKTFVPRRDSEEEYSD
jgi:hypothetical protein